MRGGGCLWRTARLLNYVEQYLQNYGDRVLHGETEWDAEGIIRIAGWRGGIARDKARLLRLAVGSDGPDDYVGFVQRLSDL